MIYSSDTNSSPTDEHLSVYSPRTVVKKWEKFKGLFFQCPLHRFHWESNLICLENHLSFCQPGNNPMTRLRLTSPWIINFLSFQRPGSGGSSWKSARVFGLSLSPGQQAGHLYDEKNISVFQRSWMVGVRVLVKIRTLKRNCLPHFKLISSIKVINDSLLLSN